MASGAPVHRGSRRPFESEESTVFDTPYSASTAPTSARPLTHPAGATGAQEPTLAFSKPKEESYLGSAKEWVVKEPLLAKGKLEKSRRGDGPLSQLGGGLEKLSKRECGLLLALLCLAFIVRLWRIDRPASVVYVPFALPRFLLFQSANLFPP